MRGCQPPGNALSNENLWIGNLLVNQAKIGHAGCIATIEGAHLCTEIVVEPYRTGATNVSGPPEFPVDAIVTIAEIRLVISVFVRTLSADEPIERDRTVSPPSHRAANGS